MYKTIIEIQEIFENYGQDAYFGEHVTQLQHALQSYDLAQRDQADDEMQIAAFLHDIGHMIDVMDSESDNMNGYGNKDHESLAKNWLIKRGFSEKIQTVVSNHVLAKKYLCFTNQEYYESLSDASKKTLEYQGGIMNKNEAELFSQSPYFEESIMLRKWDDLAKIPDAPLPDFDQALKTIEKYFDNHSKQ